MDFNINAPFSEYLQTRPDTRKRVYSMLPLIKEKCLVEDFIMAFMWSESPEGDVYWSAHQMNLEFHYADSII